MILALKRLPILETERLRLEPLTADDAGHVFPLMDDPEVMAYWDSPEVDDPDVVAEIVGGQVAAMAAGAALYWSMRRLGGGEFLGVCDLSEIDRRHRRAEVGFMLSRDAWGQGYALEAMRTVTAYAASSGLRKLTARTHLGNRRSEALLEKLGFKEEGLLRGHILKDGERRDCRLFGLLLQTARAYLAGMTSPIRVQGFDHIVLRVRDKASMLRFYEGVLGLTVDRDRPELGLTHIRCGPQMIDLVTLEGPLGKLGGDGPGQEGRNLDHFCLQVRPFDEAAIRAHLAAHGVVVVEEGQRYGADGTGFSLYVRDPEGNTVELKGPSQ